MKTKKKTIWIVLGIILFIVFIASIAGGGDENSKDDAAISTDQTWTEVIQLSGTGDKKSETFTYSGKRLRMRYNYQASDFGAFAAYVVQDGKSLMEDGGMPEVTLDAGEEGTSNLSHLRKGDYYLDVMSANGKWTIIIEELQ